MKLQCNRGGGWVKCCFGLIFSDRMHHLFLIAFGKYYFFFFFIFFIVPLYTFKKPSNMKVEPVTLKVNLSPLIITWRCAYSAGFIWQATKRFQISSYNCAKSFGKYLRAYSGVMLHQLDELLHGHLVLCFFCFCFCINICFAGKYSLSNFLSI